MQAKEIKQFYGDAFAKYFREEDLTYGDSLFASQRLTEALVRFYNQYVRDGSYVTNGTLTYSSLATFVRVTHLISAISLPETESTRPSTTCCMFSSTPARRSSSRRPITLDSTPCVRICLSEPRLWMLTCGAGTKRCGGILVGVPMDIDEDGWEAEGDVESRMERAWQDCQAKGIPVRLSFISVWIRHPDILSQVKVVIITNPGNPIGRTRQSGPIAQNHISAYPPFLLQSIVTPCSPTADLRKSTTSISSRTRFTR